MHSTVDGIIENLLLHAFSGVQYKLECDLSSDTQNGLMNFLDIWFVRHKENGPPHTGKTAPQPFYVEELQFCLCASEMNYFCM